MEALRQDGSASTVQTMEETWSFIIVGLQQIIRHNQVNMRFGWSCCTSRSILVLMAKPKLLEPRHHLQRSGSQFKICILVANTVSMRHPACKCLLLPIFVISTYWIHADIRKIYLKFLGLLHYIQSFILSLFVVIRFDCMSVNHSAKTTQNSTFCICMHLGQPALGRTMSRPCVIHIS